MPRWGGGVSDPDLAHSPLLRLLVEHQILSVLRGTAVMSQEQLEEIITGGAHSFPVALVRN